MTKTEYAEYLNSPHWKTRRLTAIEEAGAKCQRCELPRWLAELVYDQDLHVHHVSYGNRGEEKSEDLEVLCRRCHELETFKRSELRPLHKATCQSCGTLHWSYRSNLCPACIEVESDPEIVIDRLKRTHPIVPDYMTLSFLCLVGVIDHLMKNPKLNLSDREVISFMTYYTEAHVTRRRKAIA